MTVETRVVVISLPEAAGRRAGRARQTGLAWRFFDGHRELGNGLTYDPDHAVVAKGRPMFPGELGCYSSHYHAWLELLDSGASQMIVLEDEIIVDWGFLERAAAVDFEADGVRYLRLFAERPCAFRLHGEAVEPKRYLVEFAGYAHGTQGHVITRRGAERLARHCRAVRRPVDIELDRAWDHAVPCLAVFPFPVMEISTASSIGAARWERFEIPAGLRGKRLRTRLTERARRIGRYLRVMTRPRSPAAGLSPP